MGNTRKSKSFSDVRKIFVICLKAELSSAEAMWCVKNSLKVLQQTFLPSLRQEAILRRFSMLFFVVFYFTWKFSSLHSSINYVNSPFCYVNIILKNSAISPTESIYKQLFFHPHFMVCDVESWTCKIKLTFSQYPLHFAHKYFMHLQSGSH